MEITTIKLSKKTKNRLDNLKTHKRDSYEDIVERILSTLNICRVNPIKAKAHLAAIARKNRKIKPQLKEKIKLSSTTSNPENNPQP